MRKIIIGATIGGCVHAAGIINFLKLAADNGYDTEFLGVAVPLEKIFRDKCDPGRSL